MWYGFPWEESIRNCMDCRQYSKFMLLVNEYPAKQDAWCDSTNS